MSVPHVSGAVFYNLFIVSDYAAGTVTLDPVSDTMSYLSGTVVTITITPDPDGSYIRYIYGGVEGTGTGSYTGGATTFQVTMNGDIDEYILWQIQYTVDFETSGISGETGSNVIVTVNGVAKTYADLPFLNWYDSGAEITFSFSPTVVGTGGLSYVHTGELVYYYDASGNLLTAQLAATYTVWTHATITGFYTVTTSTITTSATTTVSSTATTSTGTGGYIYSTATTMISSASSLSTEGGATPLVEIPMLPLSEFFNMEGFSHWFDASSFSNFNSWFNGSSCPIDNQHCYPNMYILIGIIGLFIILFFYYRKKKEEES